jgi:hypothetical protein
MPPPSAGGIDERQHKRGSHQFVLPMGEPLNALLGHIGEAHPEIWLRGIDLGRTTVLRTDRGDLPLRPAEEFE